MEINKNGVHYMHYVAPSKVMIVFGIVLAIIVIIMMAYQEKEIHDLRVQVNELRNYYVKMTGDL
jgi:hypothetical protein